MERLKFEKQFAKTLKAREIPASENSWKKLNEQLQDHQKSTGRRFWWLGIAASLVGGILVLSLVFKKDSIPASPGLVNTPTKVEKKKISEPVLKSSEKEIRIASEENKEPLKAVERKKKSSVYTISHTNKVQSSIAKTEVGARNLEKSKFTEVLKASEISAKNDVLKNEITSQDINEVLTEIASAQNKGKAVTDAEVDALLQQAAERIAKEKTYSYDPQNIDANALLQDVELEINDSFREKVFEILKEGFNKARSAVANRNN